MKFEFTIRPLEDSKWAVVEYEGTIDFQDGSQYNNTYIGLFHVVDEELVLSKEFFNPIVLLDSFDNESLEQTFSTEQNMN